MNIQSVKTNPNSQPNFGMIKMDTETATALARALGENAKHIMSIAGDDTRLLREVLPDRQLKAIAQDRSDVYFTAEDVDAIFNWNSPYARLRYAVEAIENAALMTKEHVAALVKKHGLVDANQRGAQLEALEDIGKSNKYKVPSNWRA